MNHKLSTSRYENLRQRDAVLIVDDEAAIRLVLTKRIQAMRPQYDVYSAESAEKAVEMLEQRTFNVMVTDLKLPHKDGLALADYVHQEFPRTWSILMTGYGTDAVHKNAYKTGCVAYIEKPLDSKLLLRWIDNAMERNGNGKRREPPMGSAKPWDPRAFLRGICQSAEANDKPWYTPLYRNEVQGPQTLRHKILECLKKSSSDEKDTE